MDLLVNRGIFLVYCVVVVAIGYWGYRKTKNPDDFSVASKSLGMGVSIPLYAASFLSAASIIGFSGTAFATGWNFLLIYPLGLASGWVLLQAIAGKFRRGPHWNTTPDVFAERFESSFMRGWMAVFNIAYMFFYVVIGLMGVAIIISTFLGIPSVWAFLVVGAVFLAYTSLGGMYSVAWTNVVQFALLAAGIIGAAIFGLAKVGGVGNLVRELSSYSDDSISAGDLVSANMGGSMSPLYIFGTALGFAVVVPVTTYYHRMFFSAKDERTARGFVGFSAVILMILYLAIGIIGFSARVLLPSSTLQEEAFPKLVGLMPTLLGGLVLAAIASAVMSSMDNQLLAAGVMASRDIFQKMFRPDASEDQVRKFSQWATFVIGLGAILLALARVGLIIEVYTFFVIISATTLFVPLALALFWRRTTKEAGIAGTLLGFGGGTAWWFLGPDAIPATIPLIPLVFLVMVVVSVLTPKPSSKTLDMFFGADDSSGLSRQHAQEACEHP